MPTLAGFADFLLTLRIKYVYDQMFLQPCAEFLNLDTLFKHYHPFSILVPIPLKKIGGGNMSNKFVVSC